MSFFNFFRNIFSPGGNQRSSTDGFDDQWHRNDEFRNPIWQTDEDEDDIDDFRRPQGQFNIDSDPFQIARYFESQMDNMLKNFFFGFEQDGKSLPFGNDGIISSFGIQGPENFGQILPAEPKRGNLRDDVLKPGYGNHSASPDSKKADVDLDGKISTDDMLKVWSDPPSSNNTQSVTPRQSPFSFHSFGQSMSTKIIRKADGSIEQHKVVRDSQGNEETTITRQLGDKQHTTVTKIDKNGVKTETNFVGEAKSNEHNFPPFFNAPFRSITEADETDYPNQSPLNHFPWHKFFGPNPKL